MGQYAAIIGQQNAIFYRFRALQARHLNVVELRVLVYLSSFDGLNKRKFFKTEFLHCVPATVNNSRRAARYRLAGVTLKYLGIKGLLIESKELRLTAAGWDLVEAFERFARVYFDEYKKKEAGEI